MKYAIVIEPRAISDIQDAIDYYEFKKIGLGDYFYEIVDKTIQSLTDFSNYQIRYKDYHGLPMKIFPFIILYFVDELDKTIYIMSVFNTSMNPKKYSK
ncbi:type II toxin-antitoxin system RelE/ParE family toxin [Flavobacterium jejuense]|uniref:Type II toxin-antitoxin system RelE/ParE family toxin n=1 Tax=Flavobacterium jejuense TaxID=1544455 RepID=A0ABX0IVV2_9FLAO|nr:type II toxin-antitoxin system RelE/ParE family toxin [Flavobacterium jejuense]NHN26929.1 type II toxin-antitoxin system RelE/ParE family toxin [Flavobacterium jejuense]